MPPAQAATVLIADGDPSQWVGPGLLGFVIIAGLCVGTYFLWRNMNKQIRRVTFDDGSEPQAEAQPQPEQEPASKENGDQPAGSSKQS